MKSRINIHSKAVTNSQPSTQARTCNCINKFKCPLNSKCLGNNVLYKTNVTLMTKNYRNKLYYGVSGPNSNRDTQTIENLLKTENTKQTLNFLMKSGN